MTRYEFDIITLNRHHVRDLQSAEFRELNEKGAQGFRIVSIRDDPRDGSQIVFFLQREISG